MSLFIVGTTILCVFACVRGGAEWVVLMKSGLFLSERLF